MANLAAVSESLYGLGVEAISALQLSFPDGESFFIDVSKVFDPKYVFTLYFPIVFALQWALGVQLLGTIIVVEWLNQVLKWLMHGDRPYWWIHEVEAQNTSVVLPDILQYSTTCETGPGTPSGHSMAMSAVWYVIAHAVVERVIKPSNMSSMAKQYATTLAWGVFAIFQVLIISSRLYIAAHFPHQCFLGLVLGVSVARQVYGTSKWLNLKRAQWLSVASFILASAVGTYWTLLVSGSDPAWSISRAIKWCAKREYIHVDTTPFYSMMRYSGAAFGLGLGLTSRFFAQAHKSQMKSRQILATMILGVMAGYAAELTHFIIPKTNESVFYSMEFVLNVALPYAIVALVPYAVTSSSGKAKSS
jgi:glucose-6-phosphatase